MITYQDIVAANATITTTPIKGKDYAEVNQRIKAFRMLYPEGYIRTELLLDEGGKAVMTAECGYYAENGDEHTLGTGTAYELSDSSYINKTSYIENCETSAVGRALGMAGFGIDTSVASYEEVDRAISQQETKQEPLICADCGKPIEDRRKKSGEIWKGEDIATYTYLKYNRRLCAACGQKREKADAGATA